MDNLETDEEVDLYYPIFMTVRFLFIFGWLRVAETLYNPFGEDDEDFELNELLNRHFKVSMSIVDEHEDPPELQKDMFWNHREPELIEPDNWSEENIPSDVKNAEEVVFDNLLSLNAQSSQTEKLNTFM